LAAGGTDVLALAPSDEYSEMMLDEKVLKSQNGFAWRSFKRAALKWIERNQVDFCSKRFKQSGQADCVFRAVIDL